LAPANVFNISCTPTHPFWRIGSANGGETGWILASELKPKDVLRGRNRNLVVCASATDWESQVVYNLRIDGEHTYFVTNAESGEAIWTHNACTLINRFNESVAKAAQDPLVKKRLLGLVKKAADKDLSDEDLVSLWKIASETKPASLPGVCVAKDGTDDLIAGMKKLYPANGVDGPGLLNNVAHHILPGKALQGHELSKIVGIIFDHESNGIWLPGKAGGGATKSIHAGKHGAYSAAMQNRMDKILIASGMQLSDPSTWTTQALKKARADIATMQKRALSALNEGRLQLCKNYDDEIIDENQLRRMWTKVFEGGL
jgi:A nuclease family of the HNH/ENDO VII superfamily with conserved AHH/Pretoxin HINT domain